ncbi:MAG: hypothetical protein HKN82_11575 [Akkermansiaceae bacterium]|nr:hypothetical protein [Akkermansiaceae bacterium]NNM28389.1 hypothetical protein [Akkermansiaceae bacterium]
MKSLVFQIGAGVALVLCGVLIGMQIGTRKVVVVRSHDPAEPVVRAHQTAAEVERSVHRSKRVRQAPPTVPTGSTDRSPAELRLDAGEIAREWIAEVMQDEDDFRRDKGLEAIRHALREGSKVEVLAGLHAFLNCLKADFDKAPFRELIEPHLTADDAWARRNAWYALYHTERRDGDVELVRALADDPSREVRESASHLIAMYEDGDLTGDSGDIVLGMLNNEDQAMRREVLRGMWGAAFSPELEARVIELSRADDRDQQHDAIYFALSTQANKSVGSVLRLIEVLGDPDWNNSGRASWGLRYGVPEDAEPMVAEAALRMMQEDAQGRSWKYGLELLKRYAGPEQLEAIEALAAREELPAPLREELAEAELQAARGR